MGNEEMCCPQKIIEGGEMVNEVKPVKYTSRLRIFDQQKQIKKQSNSTFKETVVQTNTRNKPQRNSNISNQKQSEKMSKESLHVQKEVEKIQIPQLSQQIKRVLKTLKPFESQLKQRQLSNIKLKKFKDDVYEGELDAFGRPQGYGRLYKSSGNFIIADFINGVVQNHGIAIMKNGSYYLGSFRNNQAYDLHGQYVSEQFQYEGGFSNNKLNGQGKEHGQTYTFQGNYKDNMKIRGTYCWDINVKGTLRQNNSNINRFNYEYTGSFDKEQLFTGFGTLMQPKGDYKGQFAKGKKHGKGQYLYKTKLKYEGQYYQNVKQGLGILTNYDESVAYKGEWKNGLPNGKGSLFDQKGNQIPSTFIDGLSCQILPLSQTQRLNRALERAGQ